MLGVARNARLGDDDVAVEEAIAAPPLGSGAIITMRATSFRSRDAEFGDAYNLPRGS
ncbi:MAG: hypothetical protein AMXMBFR55_22960 [Gemmatimonadota bacterium]